MEFCLQNDFFLQFFYIYFFSLTSLFMIPCCGINLVSIGENKSVSSNNT